MKKQVTHIILVILLSLNLIAYSQGGKQDNPTSKGQLLQWKASERSEKMQLKAATVIWEETFESGTAFWDISGCWNIGQPSTGPVGGYNSSNCAATNLEGNYPNYANEWLISDELFLPEVSNPLGEYKLNLWQWFAIESGYDNGYVKISIDQGINWDDIYSISGSSGWVEATIDITPYHGHNIQIAFQFTSDYSVTYDGWYIDNLSVEYEEPEYLTATITNLNAQNFPFIYLNVAVDTNGVGIATLDQSNFIVTENEIPQTNYYEVFPPDTAGGVRRADIIFIMDNSGSMDEEQNAIENNVIDFVDNLSTSGVDFALGLCRYGQDLQSGIPIIEDNGVLTSDANYFKYDVWQRNVIDGGDEPGYYSIVQSNNGFIFRPGSQKIFIIITDESPDQGYATLEEAKVACINNSVTLFALTETDLFTQFQPITDETNGAYYDIYSNFDDILDAISNQVANSYLIKYASSDHVFNGILRHVKVNVEYNGNENDDNASYTPGEIPAISRTNLTLSHHEQAWIEGTSFNIEADIIDLIEPLTTGAILYFKNTDAITYQYVSMQNTSETHWSGIIPGSAVITPGIDYYITATDGISTASDPSVNPINYPYQIAILPNFAPTINHTPIGDISVNLPVEITAEIQDNTNVLEFAGVFYRKYGQLSYQSTDLELQQGNTYLAIIPAQYATEDGLEYYIYAVDDFLVGNYSGTPDNPHFATTTPDFADYLYEKQEIITNISLIERPFLGTSKPFYNTIEIQAQNFLTNVTNDYNNGIADPLDLEGIARLTLSERVSYRGVTDAIEISEYGAKGCKSLAFSYICKQGLKHVGKAVKHIPIIGNKLYNGIQGVNDKVTHSIDKLNLAFYNGFEPSVGELSIEQIDEAFGATNQGMSNAQEEIFEFVAETGLSSFGNGLFETGENIIQDYIYLTPLGWQTNNKQQSSVDNATGHLFPENSFNGAKLQTTNKLQSMIQADEIAMDAGNFTNTINEITGWIALGSALVLIIAGIVGALISGGTSLLAAIAGFATLLLTYSTHINQASAIVEAAGAAVYVNGIMPYVYINPSVDKAFGDGTRTDDYIPEKVRSIMQNSDYKISERSESLDNYLTRLRNKIVNNDTTWANTGMDSLAYYEAMANQEDYTAIAKFLASSEDAEYYILNYNQLTNLYLHQSAAYDIASAALLISATVYDAGYREASVTTNALTALDSLNLNIDRLIQNRNDINSLLLAYQIPAPVAVGIGEISAQKQSASEIKLEAKITNYGSENVENVHAGVSLNNENAVVLNNDQVINVPAQSTSNLIFNVISIDTTLFGSIKLTPDASTLSYYVLPPKLFAFDYQALTFAVEELVSDNIAVDISPNPFNPSMGNMTIALSAVDDFTISAFVYDLNGKLISTILNNKRIIAGNPVEFIWSGKNTHNEFVGNGIYFISIETNNGKTITKKVAVIH
ncbi:MAG: VWA domain-containing protein [Bacteroidales bacterium]|nr:VWA domain-containing protein [Bacteroidales bacterium]